MTARQRRWAMIAAGLVLSAVFVGLLVWDVWGDWGKVWRALRAADYAYLVPSVGLLAVMYALRVLRWKVILRPVGGAPYRHIASATLIGFMSSCILPARAGEFIRPYVLHRRAGLPFGVAAGTAGLERVFDLVGALSLLALSLTLMRGLDLTRIPSQNLSVLNEVRQKGPWLAALAVVGLCGVVALAFAPSLMLRVGEYFVRFLPGRWQGPLRGFMEHVTRSMQFLRAPGRVAAALLLTLAIWFCFPLSTYSLARGFGLDLPFAGALLAQVMITALVALPQAPGFIGSFQYAAVVGMQLFGVPTGDANAFAIVLWAINVFPITVVGLGVLWWEGLSLRALTRESEQAAGEIPAP